MRSPFNFLVKPLDGKRYNNSKTVNGKELFLNTSIEDARSTQRHAIVVATPKGYSGDVQPGDTVLVHHNTFRKLISLSGEMQSTSSHLFDDIYQAIPEHVYLYNRDGEWKAVDNFVFIRPAKNDSVFEAYKKYKPLWGEVVYSNSSLDSLGVSVGDTVCHEPECEYEFDVDGEMLYRMFTRNICLKK